MGTDIQDGKCSWLAVTALERWLLTPDFLLFTSYSCRCSPEQKQELEVVYGSREQEEVARVRDVYKELDVEGAFREYEESFYNTAMGKISKVVTAIILVPVPIIQMALIPGGRTPQGGVHHVPGQGLQESQLVVD